MDAPPILVLCNARSGSTLLRYLLDTHPDIAAPPETPLGALCASLVQFAKSLPQREDDPKNSLLASGRELIDAELRRPRRRAPLAAARPRIEFGNAARRGEHARHAARYRLSAFAAQACGPMPRRNLLRLRQFQPLPYPHRQQIQ